MKWTRSLLACLLVAVLAVAGLYALAKGKSGGLPAAESVSAAETTAADGPAIQTAGAAIALSALEHLTDSAAAPEVYFTSDISAAGLLEVYQALGWNPQGPVAVKLSTGEPPASNYLRPELIGDLVKSLDGTIVECNTAYGGSRASAALHKQVAQDHGFTAIADFDLMDEDGETVLPLTGGVRLNRAIVGSHIDNYDSFLILSHFKGHAMAGFGGALKNVAIGMSSPSGKVYVHTAGTRTQGSVYYNDQDAWLEALPEMVKAVRQHVGAENMAYVNVMNRLSVDCDCNGHPAEPDMHDIGILASRDPVALDQACVDLIYAAPDSASMIRRMERQNGVHALEHAEEIDLGSRAYRLIRLSDAGSGTEPAQTENLYAIRNLTVGENAVSAALNAEDDCSLFVALYEENGRMLDVCAKIISGGAEEQNIQVDLSANGTEFFQAKAFLMDDRFFKPLCGSFSVYGPSARSAVTSLQGVPMATLNNGVQMPRLGLGTQIQRLEAGGPNATLTETSRQSVVAALQAGYRHLDTAHGYYNERGVGQGIIDSGVPREEIWLTSKLWPSEYGEGVTMRAIDDMLERLQTDYLDLLYLHHPAGDYVGAWKDMEKAYRQGKVRALGISNFDNWPKAFHDIVDDMEIKPQVLQIECHPFAQRQETRALAAEYGIQIECWYPLGHADPELLGNSVLAEIAAAHNRSAAQIILRWHMQEGFSAVPGSTNPEHIRENIDIFDFTLTDAEMERIRGMDSEKRYFNLPYERMGNFFPLADGA